MAASAPSTSSAEPPPPNDPVVYAHSRDVGDPRPWEPLETHLRDVEAQAAAFASAFDSADWGALSGRWHDLGKYRPEFQRRIRGEPVHAPHASAGAALAGEQRLHAIAYAIAGHHAGLANSVRSTAGGPTPLREALVEGGRVLDAIRGLLPPSLTTAVAPQAPAHLCTLATDRRPLAHEFWTRMLFSALIDADRLATEAFYEPAKRQVLTDFDTIGWLDARLDRHLAGFIPDTPVNALRASVLADCRAAATREPGFFSLSVPTGGGKTLSGMAFALRHAERYALRRVIVVAPFTSIIEQNANVYRDVFGARNVIEHHSALDESARLESDHLLEVRRRLAVENWDAPIIVTTAVQFFESLFANSPSACRKLHNVVRSVIVLDEAQTLPTEYLAPVLDVLQELVRGYGCTIVLSTATQPALTRRQALPEGIERIDEIVAERDTLALALRRVRVSWPAPGGPPTPYSELAARVSAHERALVVVHRRQDARLLAEQLPSEGLFHLSTRMCAAHRLATFAQIRKRLRGDGPCRVVSTQLIEAGVDLSFPIVFRALAGLDSVAQAAGRCNRNGELAGGDGLPMLGEMIVFRAETAPPPGVLRKGLSIAEDMLTANGDLDFTDAATMEQYFRMLYRSVPHDLHGVQSERELLNFAEVARLVHLVDDDGQSAIVVPWGDAPARLQAFVVAPGRETARALQPFVVQLRPRELAALERLGAVLPVDGIGHELLPQYAHMYDARFGLAVDDEAAADPAKLIR